jgi:hypothetical protein
MKREGQRNGARHEEMSIEKGEKNRRCSLDEKKGIGQEERVSDEWKAIGEEGKAVRQSAGERTCQQSRRDRRAERRGIKREQRWEKRIEGRSEKRRRGKERTEHKEKGIGPVPRPMPLGPSGCILRASWVGDALKSNHTMSKRSAKHLWLASRRGQVISLRQLGSTRVVPQFHCI